ncbi:MAG: hypothetical protein RLZZ165_558 [Bacteroidota bacterium]
MKMIPSSLHPGFARGSRALIGAVLTMAMVFQSCLRPVEGDFPTAGQGLADDELLWVLSIPATPEEADLPDLSMRDSIRFANYNKPLFDNVLQRLVKGILNGEVRAWDEYPGLNELKDARERLIQMGGTGQNIEPLLKVVELYIVVNITHPEYNGRPEFLRLIWRDPAGREADRGFAGVRLDNDGSSQFLPGDHFLSEFAKIESYYAKPVYLRTNFREYAIQSLEEARYIENMIYSGRWSEVDWEDEGINISGERRVALTPESVAPLAGFYRFKIPSKDQKELYAELYLTAENDYLVADWSNRFKIEKILPYGPLEFFSNSGERYWFEMKPDSNIALFVIQGQDTLGSYQNPVF